MRTRWRHFPYARARDFHDGDTLEVEVDQGFGTYQRVAVRLYGISAPEVSGAEKPWGLRALEAARASLWGGGFAQEEDLFRGKPCELWTWKQSFTRYVGCVGVYHGASAASGTTDLARSIIARGAARAWDGKTARPSFESFPVADVGPELDEYDLIRARDFHGATNA